MCQQNSIFLFFIRICDFFKLFILNNIENSKTLLLFSGVSGKNLAKKIVIYQIAFIMTSIFYFVREDIEGILLYTHMLPKYRCNSKVHLPVRNCFILNDMFRRYYGT